MARHPVHVTLRVAREVPNLRSQRRFAAVERALRAGKVKAGFRLCQFAVLSNHIHMIVEADDRTALSRGVQGLAIRLARAINRACGRAGKVWADRYHARALTSPTTVRNGLRYVLLNQRRHMSEAERRVDRGVDGCSSAPWFAGWRDYRPRPEAGRAPPVATPETWLLGEGWQRAGGLLGIDETPADPPPRRR